jgi:PQQ-dependent dehydrogenase (methanol/ethanol family)
MKILACVVAVMAAAVPAAAQPQTDRETNPLAGNAKAIEHGRNVYRGRCAVCHGMDAKGYRGTDLTTGEWQHGGTDAQLFRTIARGVPGTEMPAHVSLSEDEVWMVLAYLRTLAVSASAASERGDATRGEQMFWASDKGNCGQCHMVNGRGGRLGPHLSRIGAARSPAALEREIRKPAEVIPVGFEAVTVVTRDGRKLRGTRKSEDAFSIQLMTATEDILSFLKRDITEVIAHDESLMPAYGADRLPDADLADVVRYLRSLKGTVTVAQDSAMGQQVTSDHLAATLGADPTRWLHYSGDYSGQRHSPLTQLTAANVGQLSVQWAFQTGVLGKFETTPLVIDGVMYVTGPENTAWALDARTGRQIWRYQRQLPEGLDICCGRVNRGFAALGNRLYMTTLDAHVVALDMKTGSVVWDSVIDDYKKGYSGTAAPLIVKDKVVVGIAGAEYGIRGFIDAFDAATGKKVWRFWTVPGPGEKGSETWTGTSWERGGGSTWVTGTYDPTLDLIYWGTGNPGPDLYGKDRIGDNLYTDAVVALDPATGALKWYYQFTPHDVHDWDATQVPVLADITVNGAPRKTLMLANRNGFFYTLDRTNGSIITSRSFIRTTWAEKIGDNGRPVVLPNTDPNEKGNDVCPDITGGTNWMSPAFNPKTGLFYVTTREVCATYYGWEQEFVAGEYYFGGAAQRLRDRGYGAMRAIDPKVAGVKWEFKYFTPSMAGVLTTASDLVFGGDMDGNVMAFDATSGKNLWHFQTGAPVYAAPITYMLDGRQYVVMPSGTTLYAFALARQ